MNGRITSQPDAGCSTSWVARLLKEVLPMLTETPTRIHRYHELTVSVLSLLHGWIWKFLHSAWFPHCHWRIEFWVPHGHVSLQTVFLKRTRPEAFSNHEEHKSWVISVGKNIVHSWSLGYSSAGLGQGCVSKSARVLVNNIEKKKKKVQSCSLVHESEDYLVWCFLSFLDRD